MEKPGYTVSAANLVSNNKAKQLPQYIAALSASLGALATGTMLGWASPAGTRLMDGEYGFPVSKEENAWVGSMATLGAACICYPIGFIMERIGRKLSMLLLVIPFTIGWILIITANSTAMLYTGRFITGVAGGAFCVTAPAYNSDIAQDEVRGTLGTFFQLNITIGILFSYAVGGYTTLSTFSIVCAVIPIIFGIIFFFMPETPYFLILRNRTEDAKKSLKWLRGDQYDIDAEFEKIETKIRDGQDNPTSFKENFSLRASKMALIICLCLMIFQQFSGVNAVLFNVNDIFSNAGADISPENSAIIIGVIQVVATLVSTSVIDKVGRIVLLLISAIAMVICNVALGVYFHLQENGGNPETLANISWLPLVSLCIFIIAFSLGFGPIPWLVSGEMCAPNIKAFVSSSAATFNWVLAFIITTTFTYMKADMGEGGVFWFFAAVTFLGIFFIYFVIPETKGKSNDEVQAILNKEPK